MPGRPCTRPGHLYRGWLLPDEDGSADLSHVLTVAREIGRHADRPRIVVNKSTVPVGTGAKVRGARRDVFARVLGRVESGVPQGEPRSNFMKPDRVIVGTGDERHGK